MLQLCSHFICINILFDTFSIDAIFDGLLGDMGHTDIKLFVTVQHLQCAHSFFRRIRSN